VSATQSPSLHFGAGVVPPGTGRYFGRIKAVEFKPDGTLTGYADPRRTNVAAGY
jgi:gamma-glutamyltranspeptidase